MKPTVASETPVARAEREAREAYRRLPQPAPPDEVSVRLRAAVAAELRQPPQGAPRVPLWRRASLPVAAAAALLMSVSLGKWWFFEGGANEAPGSPSRQLAELAAAPRGKSDSLATPPASAALPALAKATPDTSGHSPAAAPRERAPAQADAATARAESAKTEPTPPRVVAERRADGSRPTPQAASEIAAPPAAPAPVITALPPAPFAAATQAPLRAAAPASVAVGKAATGEHSQGATDSPQAVVTAETGAPKQAHVGELTAAEPARAREQLAAVDAMRDMEPAAGGKPATAPGAWASKQLFQEAARAAPPRLAAPTADDNRVFDAARMLLTAQQRERARAVLTQWRATHRAVEVPEDLRALVADIDAERR